jgi:DNA polymerase III epsilon subunit-like protein
MGDLMKVLAPVVAVLLVVGLMVLQFFWPTRRRPTGLRCAQLTRRRTPYPAKGLVFTAIDIETTGLDPYTDRIVEIGLVKFTSDGEVFDEFATLVNNPGSTREAREIHHIEDTDLVGAPSIGQVLLEAFAFIAGTVLVAHNLDFEESFLVASAQRAGIALPATVGLCTLRTSRRQLDGRAFSLVAMYKTATGGWADHKHTALGDARCVREVLLWLLNHSPSPLYLTEPAPNPVTPTAVDTCPISCRPAPLTRASVAELLTSFPQSRIPRRGDHAAIARYNRLLDESVQDGRLSFDEAAALLKQARLTRVTGTQLRELHRNAWDAAFPEEASADWTTLTPLRRREMFLLAEALGLNDLADKTGAVIRSLAEPEPPPEARYLRGLRVGVIGDDPALAALRERAESYGAKIAVNMTKTVEWLATVTPDATDSRHNTARTLGIPMLTPDVARGRLDESIRQAEFKAFERQREADEWEARRRESAAEADAYWRPTWRRQELDHDPQQFYGDWERH